MSIYQVRDGKFIPAYRWQGSKFDPASPRYVYKPYK